jgi:hypothetical protein
MAKDNSFNEQAYLMWEHYIQGRKGASRSLSDLRSEPEKTGMTFHKVVGNYQPGDFISKVLSSGNKFRRFQHILDMESYKISSLVPEVKLFRISGNKYVPFYFPEASERVTMGSLLAPGSSLGAVGIKSFDVSFVGKDFHTRDKLIECSLSIHTDSMENIFKNPPAGFAQISELFTISSGQNGLRTQIREGFSKEVATDSINRPFSHEIGALMGYAAPDGGGVFSSQERQAIQNTSLMLRLTYTGHNIGISQDGQTTINITYVGRMDGSLNNSAYNILADKGDIIELTKIQSEINFFKNSRSANQADVKEKIVKLQAKSRDSKRKQLRGIVEILEKEGKVNFSSISPAKLSEYLEFVNQGASTSKKPSKKEPAPKAQPTSKGGTPDKKTSQKTQKLSDNNTSIQYFLLGDYVKAVVQSMVLAKREALAVIDKDTTKTTQEKASLSKDIEKTIKNLKSYKMLYGNTPIRTGRDQIEIANLADIPVSAKVLAQYMFEDVIQSQAAKLTLSSFLDRLVGKLYPSCLNDHLYKDASNLHETINVRSMTISAQDMDLSALVPIDDLQDVLAKANVNRNADEDKEYYLIYSEMTIREAVSRSGNRDEDLKSGVYHFNIAKDRGMVKSIDFSQATVQYRKEALMLESVSLFDELKMPYNVTITMHGNTLFMPGSMIYVNPGSIGFGDPRNARSAAARLGIGGYYIIVSVKTSFVQGIVTTTLDARHQDWASGGNTISTLEEMEQLGITSEARRQRSADKNPFLDGWG